MTDFMEFLWTNEAFLSERLQEQADYYDRLRERFRLGEIDAERFTELQESCINVTYRLQDQFNLIRGI